MRASVAGRYPVQLERAGRRAAAVRRAPRALALLLALSQCQSGASFQVEPPRIPDGYAAWNVVYGVLQHPRCANCHPRGDEPLQGNRNRAHEPDVGRGPDGRGAPETRCATCHLARNQTGAGLAPGAPDWRMPRTEKPLVLQGRSSGELCRELRDPLKNGGRTPEQLLESATANALIDWAWSPGEGRTPIPIPRAAFVEALRAWVRGGCRCPE